MNIIEAIKSGKPFRRPKCAGWMWVEGPFFVCDWEKDRVTVFPISVAALIADDWDTQEPTVTITISDFYRAVADVIKQSEDADVSFASHTLRYHPFRELARGLGLERDE